ncbi:MAG: hypothetical protein AMK72_01035 [Planctomycetes bacterium SM23_25]|nr:MAG: hypothetical protein AMS14_00655 [Planctomycetes bacterium DG_20]KPK50916.1 MAG: hypothetical protein AMK72_01035 [Planctomycetes bacterium SM23_25]
MSGPKRGTWHIPYDPTPARLDDLSEFAARQRTWLERHGGLVERFLGTQALAEARRAYQLVLACVEDGDPDAGFDAYGAAWALFNALHRDACEARRRRILEVQERQQRAAREVLAECTQVWAGEENQRLLSRWLEPVERARLESDLAAAAAGPAEEVRRKSRAWQANFGRALTVAGRRAGENARAVRAAVPELRSAAKELGRLNVPLLPEDERKRFARSKARLEQKSEAAIVREDLGGLRSAVRGLRNLAAKYESRVRSAELRKAAEAWRAALANCGYAVAWREERDGTLVLEASGFPTRMVTVQVRPRRPRTTPRPRAGAMARWPTVRPSSPNSGPRSSRAAPSFFGTARTRAPTR